MKSIKLFSLLLLVVFAFSVFSSCSDALTEPVRIITLKGPTGMGMAKLIDDNMSGDKYTFEIASAPDVVTAELIKGSCDIAALPLNVAAALYNKQDGAFQIAAVNTLGVLYILENGNTIKSVSDLKGKTLYATGQASTPEYILRSILMKNGIDPDKDITIIYKAEHTELATLIASGEVDLAMLPEPNVTTALSSNSSLRTALSLTDEWNKINPDTKLAQGCIVVRREFAERYPAALSAFLDEYKSSVDYVNSNLKEASLLIEKHGIIPKAALAEKAIPSCNICFYEGDEMLSIAKPVLQLYFESNNASVGGKLPDDAFYFKR